jgi:hypothetical protein
MRKGLTALLCVVATSGLGMVAAMPVSADPTGNCPDGFLPVGQAPPGTGEDRNGDGIVCSKARNGTPDGTIDKDNPGQGLPTATVFDVVDNTLP